MSRDIFPHVRMRRLRQTPALRDLVRENCLTMNDLVLPLFVEEGIDDAVPIQTMPGIARIPESKLSDEIKAIHGEGIKAVMLFGVSHNKDETGSDSWKPDGLLARMIKRAKDAAPNMIVISDICLCEYTTHGHCGVVHENRVDNDATLGKLVWQAVNAASAGADIVAPSAMMDGQVAAMRQGLDDANLVNTPIMAYSTKFASSFYAPFRGAAGCSLNGDRHTYQIDAMNGREAARESLMDEAEGADILMVKPGMAYLDILAKVREQTMLPLAAYQVSGEYAMIKFASAAGAIDEKRVVRETLGGFKRAGADIILTYFARDIARQGF